MRFLDRKEELKRLDRLADEEHGGFAAVWGRRRIGKSALLMEWCRRHDGLYTVADRTLAPLQRESFAVALSVRFSGFADAVDRRGTGGDEAHIGPLAAVFDGNEG